VVGAIVTKNRCGPGYREGIRQRGLEILKAPNTAVRPCLDVASLYRRAESPALGDAELTFTLEQVI